MNFFKRTKNKLLKRSTVDPGNANGSTHKEPAHTRVEADNTNKKPDTIEVSSKDDVNTSRKPKHTTKPFDQHSKHTNETSTYKFNDTTNKESSRDSPPLGSSSMNMGTYNHRKEILYNTFSLCFGCLRLNNVSSHSSLIIIGHNPTLKSDSPVSSNKESSTGSLASLDRYIQSLCESSNEKVLTDSDSTPLKAFKYTHDLNTPYISETDDVESDVETFSESEINQRALSLVKCVLKNVNISHDKTNNKYLESIVKDGSTSCVGSKTEPFSSARSSNVGVLEDKSHDQSEYEKIALALVQYVYKSVGASKGNGTESNSDSEIKIEDGSTSSYENKTERVTKSTASTISSHSHISKKGSRDQCDYEKVASSLVQYVYASVGASKENSTETIVGSEIKIEDPVIQDQIEEIAHSLVLDVLNSVEFCDLPDA